MMRSIFVAAIGFVFAGMPLAANTTPVNSPHTLMSPSPQIDVQLSNALLLRSPIGGAALHVALQTSTAKAGATDTSLPAVQLAIGNHKVIAEVAATLDQRATGLMNRFSLRQDHGMLFVFERSEPLSFWMKNTFIPLSIAFVDTSGRILNIEDMAPQTETTHWSKGPAQYALEMRKGWFTERGIAPGDRITGLPPSPAASPK